jgi:hypothetical protein
MTVIATDSTRFSAVVKSEFEPASGYCRDKIVLNDTAQTLPVGAVLGKVTATGKYRLALSASADGSQTPAAIYIADANGYSTPTYLAASTDTNAVAITRGPVILADLGLTLGTGITLAAVKAAFAALDPTILVEAAL